MTALILLKTKTVFGYLTELVIIQHGLRCSFAKFSLCAHFLQARGKRLNLLLLPRNGGLLLFDLALLLLDPLVFFEKLIEQHHVHRVVTDGVRWVA